MKVYCNPYHTLDASGRLAGACPYDPDHAAGARMFVSAELVLLGRTERDPRHRGHPDGDFREKYGFKFTDEPLSIPEPYARYYHAAARSGAILAPRDNKPPVEAWRKAREQAIADWKQRFGSEPDVSVWAEQFPFEAQIAKAPVAKAGG